MVIEARQRSPLGAPYRTPLGVFGPGVAAPVPSTLTLTVTPLGSGFNIRSLEEFIRFDDLAPGGDCQSVRGFTTIDQSVSNGSTVELVVNGPLVTAGDILNRTFKGLWSSVELTLTGTLYCANAPWSTYFPTNMASNPIGLDDGSSAQFFLGAEGFMWVMLYYQGARHPGFIGGETLVPIEDWVAPETGEGLSTLIVGDGWSAPLDIPEIVDCDAATWGVGDAKQRTLLIGASAAVAEPTTGQLAISLQDDDLDAIPYTAGMLPMRGDCWRQHTSSGTPDTNSAWNQVNAAGNLLDARIPRASGFLSIAEGRMFFVHVGLPEVMVIGDIVFPVVSAGVPMQFGFGVPVWDVAARFELTVFPAGMTLDEDTRTVDWPSPTLGVHTVTIQARNAWVAISESTHTLEILVE